MALASLKELFLEQLKDIYYAENKILKNLPEMAENATNQELRDAFENHRKETEGQIERLEQVFSELGEKAEGEQCPAMDGLAEEGDELMEETESGDVRDAGLIVAGQKVEHYEMATYGALCSWAKTLKLEKVAGLLHQNLEEEKNADELLTKIAESSNKNARGAA